MASRSRYVTEAGNINSLRLEHDICPLPSADEVQVAVYCVGLNFADIFACHGLYSATPKGTFTPGLEFSGVVTVIGEKQIPGCESSEKTPMLAASSCPSSSSISLAVGDSVMGVSRFGGYASVINVDKRLLRPLPSGWNFRQGASFVVQAMTAYYGLQTLARLFPPSSAPSAVSPSSAKQGSCVLVHSAAGGVGLMTIGLLQIHGMASKCICTVGKEEKVPLLLRLGLDRRQIIVRSGGGKTFGAQLDACLQFVGCCGIDVSMDSLLGDYFHPVYERMRADGRICVFGAASMTTHSARPNWLQLAWRWLWRPTVDPMELTSRNVSVHGFNLIHMWDKLDELVVLLDELILLFVSASSLTSSSANAPSRIAGFPPFVGHVFPFTAAVEALHVFQLGLTTGKVVLEAVAVD